MSDETPPPKSETPPPVEPPKAPGPDLAKAIEGLLAKHGDPNAALRVLLNENHTYRDTVRELKSKLPADGAVVLTGDDAQAWGEYRTLGKAAEVKKALDDGKAVASELSGLKRNEEVRTVAEIAGFKPSVLKTLAGDLAFEVKEEKGKDGKAVRVVHVKGADDKSVPLTEYAEKHWADFMPSLKGGTVAPVRPLGTPAPRPGAPAPTPAPTGQGERTAPLRRRMSALS